MHSCVRVRASSEITIEYGNNDNIPSRMISLRYHKKTVLTIIAGHMMDPLVHYFSQKTWIKTWISPNDKTINYVTIVDKTLWNIKPCER